MTPKQTVPEPNLIEPIKEILKNCDMETQTSVEKLFRQLYVKLSLARQAALDEVLELIEDERFTAPRPEMPNYEEWKKDADPLMFAWNEALDRLCSAIEKMKGKK